MIQFATFVAFVRERNFNDYDMSDKDDSKERKLCPSKMFEPCSTHFFIYFLGV
jgi:hypothetical protein